MAANPGFFDPLSTRTGRPAPASADVLLSCPDGVAEASVDGFPLGLPDSDGLSPPEELGSPPEPAVGEAPLGAPEGASFAEAVGAGFSSEEPM